MSTTVYDFIETLDSLYPSNYTDANKLKWINDLELGIYEDIIKEYLVRRYSKVTNTYQYSLPTGCLWEDIYGVWVDDRLYKKRSVMHHNESYSYYYYDSKLNLYPVPDEDDSTYTSGASELTFATNTITTTGDDYSGFTIGDTVVITGCTDQTANNKTAVITGVSETVLTFAAGTFTAQTESGTVTISEASIKMVYKNRRAAKEIDDIDTDILLLPKTFENLYYSYCYSQIAMMNREFQEANNYIMVYNSLLDDFRKWYNANKEENHDVLIDSSWKTYTSEDE